MEQRARIVTVAIARIPIRHDETALDVWSKDLGDAFRAHLQHNQHEAAHEEGAIGSLIEFVTAVVIQLYVLVVRVDEETDQLAHEFVELSEAQGSKVIVKRVIL